MPVSPDQQLVELLVKLKLIEVAPPLNVLRQRPGGPLRQLAASGDIDEVDAIEKVAEYLSIPYYDLDSPDVTALLNVASFVGKIENEVLWENRLVPLWSDQYAIEVAVVNPLDHQAIASLEFILGQAVKVVVAEELKIIRLLSQHFPAPKFQYGYNGDENESQVEILGGIQPAHDVDIEDTTSPPVIRLCNKIIGDAVRADASDIHIEPSQSGVDVRFRIDGVMANILEIPKRLQPYVLSRIKLLSGMDIAERRRPQDGRLRVLVGGQPSDMRVSSVPASFGEKLVLRVLNSKLAELSLGEIGMASDIQRRVLKVLAQRGKIILVSGPTGSGKSTTLYACLNYLRDGTSNIMTVEDPIEFRIPGIHQIQVNEAADVTFASALRSILRQDPDIIMIGEIRDSETATIALQAAQTGHLVLSTVHTNDAPSVLTRLYHLGVDPFVLSASLSGALAQRLVRKICPNCCSEPSDVYFNQHAELISKFRLNTESLLVGRGCDRCRFTGYTGRTGIFSYLPVDETVSQLIAKKAPIEEVEEHAIENGYLPISEIALTLVQQGVTTLTEVEGYLNIHRTDRAAATEHAPTPVAPQRPPQSPAAVSAQAVPVDPKSGISRQKVLLVEDDSDVRSILSILLQKEMFDVIEAENGLEGLEQVYEHNPSFIICDLMMPVMDGREFIVKMQNNANTRDIPIIVLTAVDDEDHEIDLIDLGAVDFVSKAASSSVLVSRIRRALKQG